MVGSGRDPSVYSSVIAIIIDLEIKSCTYINTPGFVPSIGFGHVHVCFSLVVLKGGVPTCFVFIIVVTLQCVNLNSLPIATVSRCTGAWEQTTIKYFLQEAIFGCLTCRSRQQLRKATEESR